MKRILTLFIIIVIILALVGYWILNHDDSNVQDVNLVTNLNKSIIPSSNSVNSSKILPPDSDEIYFGAFPDFGGNEDEVTTEQITDFENKAGKEIVWVSFSNNWADGITYPKEDIHTVYDMNAIPLVRLMPRSHYEQYQEENTYTMQNIIAGNFDSELRQWAREAKKDSVPLLIDFAVEMNGDWFSWSGTYNGKGNKEYGDKNYYDGPERYRDAYRHIINIFKEEEVNHITWIFHPDIYSSPYEEWNKAKYYYPGDDYIDWIGVSVYGPQNPEEDYWETFSEILANRHESILEISQNKPLALLEFGVTDNHPLGQKDEWLDNAFTTILDNDYLDFSAISYWHETWEESDDVTASLRIDSSQESLEVFQKYAADPRFVSSVISWYRPKPGTSWHWQLSGTINTEYDADMYDVDLVNVPQKVIDALHAKDIKVICYFSAGTWENFRQDASDFPTGVLGNTLDDWPSEKWLDISNYENFSDIMEARLDLAAAKKCDGLEPDNVDGYLNDSGFSLTYNDQLIYNKWLAAQAHKRGLAVGLKNDLEQINDLVDNFDFAVNEQCFQYDECDALSQFINQEKAVFGAEYELETKEFCEHANSMNFSWLKMDYDLDGNRTSCR